MLRVDIATAVLHIRASIAVISYSISTVWAFYGVSTAPLQARACTFPGVVNKIHFAVKKRSKFVLW